MYHLTKNKIVKGFRNIYSIPTTVHEQSFTQKQPSSIVVILTVRPGQLEEIHTPLTP